MEKIINKIRKNCSCGCNKIPNEGREYIRGHNRKGKKHTIEAKMKISSANQGNYHTKETKMKMSKSCRKNLVWLGRKHKEETKTKIRAMWSDRHKKYGRSIRPFIDNSSKAFKKFAFDVFNRDQHHCILCKSKKNLDIHHITYEKEHWFNIDNGIILCRKHHLRLFPRHLKRFCLFEERYFKDLGCRLSHE